MTLSVHKIKDSERLVFAKKIQVILIVNKGMLTLEKISPMKELKLAFPAFANDKLSNEAIPFHVLVYKLEHGFCYTAWFDEIEGSPSFDFRFENGSWYQYNSKLNIWDYKEQSTFARNIGQVIDSNIKFFGYGKYIMA